MNEMAGKSSLKRVSITVPQGDAKCIDWLNKQSNVSMSLRFLIYDAIARWGTSDITLDVLPSAMINAGKGRARKSSPVTQQPFVAPAPVEEPKENPRQPEPVRVEVPKQPRQEPVKQVPIPASVDEDDDGFVDPMAFLNLN